MVNTVLHSRRHLIHELLQLATRGLGAPGFVNPVGPFHTTESICIPAMIEEAHTEFY